MKNKLNSLGLTEEQVDSILGLVNEKINEMVPRSRLNSVLENVRNLKQQNEELENKISSTDDLTKQINQLRADNEMIVEKFQKELKIQNAKNLLSKSKARDEELVLKLLKFDEPLEDQIAKLKETKSFLFLNDNKIVGETPSVSGEIKTIQTNNLGLKLAQMTNKMRGKR